MQQKLFNDYEFTLAAKWLPKIIASTEESIRKDGFKKPEVKQAKIISIKEYLIK